MAKIELRGIVKEVTKIEKIGKTGTKKQSLIIMVPGWVDEFGDKKGEDEEWSLDIFNDRIDRFDLNSNLLDKRVICSVFVNSRKVESDGKTFYAVNTNLANLKLFEGNQPAAAKPANAW